MTTSFGTSIPQVVVFRVYKSGEHVVEMRVWIGFENSPGLVGTLRMGPSDWHLFRSCLRAHDPSRFSVHYMDDAYDWLHPAVQP